MNSTVLTEDFNYILKSLSQEEINKLKGSTIFITGCAGFLGYYFMNFFRTFGDQLGIKHVIGADNFMLGKPMWIREIESEERFSIRKFNIISDDIKNLDGVEEADFVIHMASIASPTFYRKYPIETLDANIWGLRALLDFYKEKSMKGILFFSSSEIYGNPEANKVPTEEEYKGSVSCTGPRACYDEAKRFGETICMLFAQQYHMPIGVVRPFNNFGPGMRLDDKRVPADFAKAVIENRDIEILSSGSPTRTFCYIADALVGYLKVMLHGEYDYFNIGMDAPEISIVKLAEIYTSKAKELLAYRGCVKYVRSNEEDYLTDNPQRRCPDITKAKSILHYHPTIDVEEGVGRFLKFLLESKAGGVEW